jgi:hypothetical protein
VRGSALRALEGDQAAAASVAEVGAAASALFR